MNEHTPRAHPHDPAPDQDLAQVNRTLAAVRPRFGPGIGPRLPASAPVPIDWQACDAPFRHFTATGVFDAATYQALSDRFTAILETTAGKRAGVYRLRPAPGSSDGLILGLTEKLAPAFAPLFTETWLRAVATMLGLPFLPRIEGALHANPQGSRTGWIHTDCCSAWFDESGSTPGALMLPPRRRCHYFTGQRIAPDARPVEYIRAATLIFYLCNDGWTPGDGGETAIYSAAQEDAGTLVRHIAPVNNSLFLFECSPHSYHRFVTNPGRARNSIILWLHATVADAEQRWGDGINRRSAR